MSPHSEQISLEEDQLFSAHNKALTGAASGEVLRYGDRPSGEAAWRRRGGDAQLNALIIVNAAANAENADGGVVGATDEIVAAGLNRDRVHRTLMMTRCLQGIQNNLLALYDK